MFLTQNELIELTGYEMPGWQRRWLNAHHWVYETAANGRVVVSKAYAEFKLSGSKVKETQPRLNLAAIQRR